MWVIYINLTKKLAATGYKVLFPSPSPLKHGQTLRKNNTRASRKI